MSSSNIEVRVNNEEELHIYKFVTLLTVAMEYFDYSEQVLTKNAESMISTKFKERFAVMDRKARRNMEKTYDAELKKFKTQFKEFKKKNVAMLNHMDTISKANAELYDQSVTEIIEFVDQLIIKKNE